MANYTESKAYQDGVADGLGWDLNFDTHDEVEACRYGWDEAALGSAGPAACSRAWGVDPEDEDAWRDACEDYNRGCYEGVCAPQSKRSGLAPRAER